MSTDATYGIPATTLAELAGVNVATARRWKRRAVVPEPVQRLLRILVLGDLGTVSSAWRGWRLAGDTLHGPDCANARPAEIFALPFMRAQISAYQARQRFAPQADWIAGQYVEPGELQEPAARRA